MPSAPVILWFRNDLRLHDHPALIKALEKRQPIIPVYIFESLWLSDNSLGFNRTSSHKWNYLLKSVEALNNQLEQAGGHLYLFKGNSVEILSKIYQQTGATAIVAHHEYAHEEQLMEQQLASQINLELLWGNLLYPPDITPLNPQVSPFYYTAFKNKVENLQPSLPLAAPILSRQHFYTNAALYTQGSAFSLPTTTSSTIMAAGEQAALQHLKGYISSGYLTNYEQQRDLFEGNGFSTLLSPYLATGAISPRLILQTIQNSSTDDPELHSSIQKLKQQLIWRDYYRWLFLRYGTKIFRKTGLRTLVPIMYNDMEAFNLWKDAKTKQPLIDALMTQLRETGFMSNRGRMLASYYLSKVLKVNWLWGAQWFESQLIDYDVCNNYGNWAYQSGTGTDSRINRSFNLEKQIQKFDPERKFINRWNR